MWLWTNNPGGHCFTGWSRHRQVADLSPDHLFYGSMEALVAPLLLMEQLRRLGLFALDLMAKLFTPILMLGISVCVIDNLHNAISVSCFNLFSLEFISCLFCCCCRWQWRICCSWNLQLGLVFHIQIRLRICTRLVTRELVIVLFVWLLSTSVAFWFNVIICLSGVKLVDFDFFKCVWKLGVVHL